MSDPQCCYHGCDKPGEHTVRITMPPLMPPLYLVGGTTLDVDLRLCLEHHQVMRARLDDDHRVYSPAESPVHHVLPINRNVGLRCERPFQISPDSTVHYCGMLPHDSGAHNCSCGAWGT